MKKLLLSAVAVLSLTFVNAQEENSSEGFSKGDVFVSGSLGITSNKWVDGDYKQSKFDFSPSVNYFVTENISLGVNLNVGGGKLQTTTATSSEIKNSTFGAGLNGRYYFTPASKFSVFTQLGVDFASTKYTPNSGSSYKDNSFGVALAPGINYFVSKSFSIEAKIAALSFESSKFDTANAENRTSFGLAADLSAVTFGVNYKF